jgi:hypothetical protein
LECHQAVDRHRDLIPVITHTPIGHQAVRLEEDKNA